MKKWKSRRSKHSEKNSEDAIFESENYEVGFGKPPKKSQFQKGQSGNIRGRPKGSGNMKTIIHRYGYKMLNLKGQEEQISAREAAAWGLWQMALKGDVKAFQILLEIDEEKHKEVIEKKSDINVSDAQWLRIMARVFLAGGDWNQIFDSLECDDELILQNLDNPEFNLLNYINAEKAQREQEKKEDELEDESDQDGPEK